jgi:phosphonate transport system substrate-binding protein
VLSRQQCAADFEHQYMGSPANVIKSVLLGKADAGVVFGTELEKEPAEVRQQLRMVLATPKIAPHPLSTHPRVPQAAQDAVTRSILSLASKAGGAQLLRSLRLASPVKADYERDYRTLEEVDVHGLSNWGE